MKLTHIDDSPLGDYPRYAKGCRDPWRSEREEATKRGCTVPDPSPRVQVLSLKEASSEVAKAHDVLRRSVSFYTSVGSTITGAPAPPALEVQAAILGEFVTRPMYQHALQVIQYYHQRLRRDAAHLDAIRGLIDKSRFAGVPLVEAAMITLAEARSKNGTLTRELAAAENELQAYYEQDWCPVSERHPSEFVSAGLRPADQILWANQVGVALGTTKTLAHICGEPPTHWRRLRLPPAPCSTPETVEVTESEFKKALDHVVASYSLKPPVE